MRSILITGCNRGLGLGIARRLATRQNTPEHLVATCRDVSKAEELRKLADRYRNVHIVELDVTDFDAYDDFVCKLSDIVKDDGLNVLFNNAGVSPKSTRLSFVKVDQLFDTLTVNTVAPIMLTKAVLPLLKRAAQRCPDAPMGTSKAAVVNMSSVLGSVGCNTDGGLYPYRCSKAALNMATRSMSLDLRGNGILAVALHPGWVRTQLGGPQAPMEVEESAAGVVELLGSLGEEHNGGFYQWDGKKLPW